MASLELVQRIVAEALRTGTDITPSDRLEWAYFAKAMKKLGFDESDFVQLSSFHGTNAKASREKWKAERPYPDEEGAIKKILHFAKHAGMDIKDTSAKSFSHRTILKPKPQPQPPRIYIKREYLITSCEAVIRTNLFKYLCSIFPWDWVADSFNAYLVGATKEFGKEGEKYYSGTSFPYINREGKCIDAKLMAYDTTGHRKKKGYCTNWLLATKKKKEYRDKWCLFGEHLLSNQPTSKVAVVESEKSAVIASMAYPQFVWVASGSLNNLTEERLRPLKNREIYLFPDNDGVDQWRKKMLELAKKGFAVYSYGDWIKENSKAPKDDIADIIIKRQEEEKGINTAVIIHIP